MDESHLIQTLNHLQQELNTIRTGRATPALVENIVVDAYDSKMKLYELASITVPDSHSLAISPWDLSILTPIRKALELSNLGVNPTIDSSNVIRLSIPPLTQDRRQELVKRVKQVVEEYKVRLRTTRQDLNKHVDLQLKNKEISEDDAKRQKDSIQKSIDSYVDKMEQFGDAKEQELLEI
jgi:ribosome recycling factor